MAVVACAAAAAAADLLRLYLFMPCSEYERREKQEIDLHERLRRLSWCIIGAPAFAAFAGRCQ